MGFLACSPPSPWFGPSACCTSRKKVPLGCRRPRARLVATSPAGYSTLLQSHTSQTAEGKQPRESVQITHGTNRNSSHVGLKGPTPRVTENKRSSSKTAAFPYHLATHWEDAFHSCTKPSLEQQLIPFRKSVSSPRLLKYVHRLGKAQAFEYLSSVCTAQSGKRMCSTHHKSSSPE